MKGAAKQPVYTFSQALSRAMKYCSLQERCQQEVRSKLHQWGMQGEEAEEVIVELIVQGFLSEERFARSFVRGKFNQNSWGRLKIIQALRQKDISETCIQEGLSEIEEEEYEARLEQVLRKKERTLKTGAERERKAQLARYLTSRGFESDYIWKLLNT